MSLAEDQSRHSIGGNNPPELLLAADLERELPIRTASLRERALDLAAAAGRAKIDDDDDAGKCVLLVKMMKDALGDVDAERETVKAPYLAGGRVVDNHYSDIARILALFDTRRKIVGGPVQDVLNKVDSYRREQERKAADLRRQAEEEARRQRLLAEEAERRRREAEERAARVAALAAAKLRAAEEEARRQGDRAAQEAAARARAEADKRAAEDRAQAIFAEVEARNAAQAAEDAARRAESVTAGPIDSGYGFKASGRKVTSGRIVDLKKALSWAVKLDEPAIRAAVQGVVDRQVRAKNTNIPGVEIDTDSTTIVR